MGLLEDASWSAGSQQLLLRMWLATAVSWVWMTLAQLKEHREALIDPKIEEHRGRIVKTTGDGMLVEFASVVDAVRCAVEVQAA